MQALQQASRWSAVAESGVSVSALWYGVVATLLGLGVAALMYWLLQRWRVRQRALICQVLSRERNRVSQDIHDGIGSQIVYAMSLLRPEDPGQRQALMVLDECLLGLRLTVDGLSASEATLAERLGQLRQRIEPALQRRGMRLHWDVAWEDESAVPSLNGRRAALLMMVVQEALSNVMQHADARQVWLDWEVDMPGRQWMLRIRDDGAGPSVCEQQGKGLRNMQSRAQAAGGACTLLALAEGGCEVQVRVPWESPLWERQYQRRAGERLIWRRKPH